MGDFVTPCRTAELRRQLGWRLFIALILVVLLACGVDYYQQRMLDSERRLHDLELSSKLRNAVQHELDSQLFVVRSLAAYASLEPEMSADAFFVYLQGLGKDVERLRSVVWSPGAIVRYIHPAAGNEAAIGHDLLANPEDREQIRQAVRGNQLLVSGPVKLADGGTGLIVRQPVFARPGVTESFIGFAAIVIDLPILLGSLRESEFADGAETALRGRPDRGGEDDAFHGDPALFAAPDAVISEILLPTGSWQLAVRAGSHVGEELFNPGRLAVLFASLLTAGLACLVLLQDYRAKSRLEALATAQRRNELRLHETQKLARIGGWELEIPTQFLRWSDEVYRIFELDPEQFGASYQAFLDLVHPDDRARVDELYSSSLRDRKPYQAVHRLLMKDGRIKHVTEACRTYYDQHGKPLRSYGMIQDITERVLQESALRASEERYRTITNYTFGWEYWQTPEGEIPYMSAGCFELSGYLADEFKLRPGLLQEIVHDEDRPAFIALQERLLGLQSDAEQTSGQLNFRIINRDGDVRWLSHGWRIAVGDGGRVLGIRANNSDITEIKDAELHARKLAFFDSLTGLPNRRMLFDRLEFALKQARRFHRLLAVLFLDIDKFKPINDQYGHETGDQLLIETGRRLQSCVRAGDTVARNGGDEFVVVLVEISSQADVFAIADKILRALDPEVVCGEYQIKTHSSIGIAVFQGDDQDSADELIRKADLAMYQAKRRGGRSFALYDESADDN